MDHPAGVELVANEKMVPPPFPPKEILTVSRPRTPRAMDGDGRDRTREIASEDGVYVADFAPTRYQGLVAPHALVLDLSEARGAGKVALSHRLDLLRRHLDQRVLAQGNDLSTGPGV